MSGVKEIQINKHSNALIIMIKYSITFLDMWKNVNLINDNWAENIPNDS
jgi:hypothetical protein